MSFIRINRILNNRDNEKKSSEGQKIPSRLWRHTVGRISCFMRLPFYVAAFALQTSKTALKGVISPFATLIRYAANGSSLSKNKKIWAFLNEWTFEGVAKDALLVGRLVDRTINSTLCVLAAPPERYLSFEDVLGNLGKGVLLGKHHDHRLDELVEKIVFQRAHYFKQLFDAQSKNGILCAKRYVDTSHQWNAVAG